MSILQVTTKADGAREVSELRENVQNMNTILGVPSCVLLHDQYFQVDYREMLETIEERLSDFAYEHEGLSDWQREDILNRHNSCTLSNNFTKINKGQGLGHATQICARGHSLQAHNYYSDSYEPPFANIIQLASIRVSGADYTQQCLDTRLNFAQEGREEMHLQVLLHEAGHGTGAGEPQTEGMAAILFSQSVMDLSYLQECADMRMLNTVIRFDEASPCGGDSYINMYGLPMTEVVDFIRHLPRDAVDAVDEKTLINTRFNDFDHSVRHVCAVGDVLKAQAENALATRDLVGLSQAADTALQQGMLDQKSEKIMARFMLACQRLENPKIQNIDGSVLASEKQSPLSFSAEDFFDGPDALE